MLLPVNKGNNKQETPYPDFARKSFGTLLLALPQLNQQESKCQFHLAACVWSRQYFSLFSGYYLFL